jgi:preprotein translocase subunit SecA
MRATAAPARPDWHTHLERRRVTEGHAPIDAQRWLHSRINLLARLLPRPAAPLPPAVARDLLAWQHRLAPLDPARFDAAVTALRAELQRQGEARTEATTSQALAIAGAAMARALGKTPYVTQYRAAWLILQGRLAEMATGEGKTLAAALAAAVAALGQVRVHLMTANDYLVQRDSEALAPFYAALGLSVGCVVTVTPRDERLRAYRCDITFVTAKELVFDYLKDYLLTGGEHDPRVSRARALQQEQGRPGHPTPHADMSAGPLLPLLPGLAMAILDEADAILLDEASMPLILALPGAPVDALGYARAFEVAAGLQRERDYRAFAAARAIGLTDAGRERVDQAVAGAGGVLTPPQRAHELVEAALAA